MDARKINLATICKYLEALISCQQVATNMLLLKLILVMCLRPKTRPKTPRL